MIKVHFALFVACSLASTAYAIDPTPVPKSTPAPAPAKTAPAKAAPAPAARPAAAPVYRAPAAAPARPVQTGPTAQQQAAAAAETQKARNRVNNILPASPPVVTPSTRTVNSAIAEAKAKPTVQPYRSTAKPVTVPSPVTRSSYNPTGDAKIEAGYKKQTAEIQARKEQARAAQAAADKAKADKAKRQMWDKPPGS